MNIVSRYFFGCTAAGEQTELITLDNGRISCRILTYGAILQSLKVPDRNGNMKDIVLGFDTLEDYLADTEYASVPLLDASPTASQAGIFSWTGRNTTFSPTTAPIICTAGQRVSLIVSGRYPIFLPHMLPFPFSARMTKKVSPET